MTAAQNTIRDYDKARMQRIAIGLQEAMIRTLMDDEGVVYIPVGEVMDATAMFLGMLLCTHPAAAVPSQLRELLDGHAKNIAIRTKQCGDAGGARVFNVVLTDDQVSQ